MNIYMVGIKGSGMSSLAQILDDDHYNIVGSDVDKYIFTEESLLKRNIKIESLNSQNYKNADLLIVGHDFMDNYFLNILRKNNIPFLEYNEFLNFYINKSRLVSICGSHGKTTLSKMITLIDDKYSYLVGDGEGKKSKNEEFFILESCEYKNHFLKYNPFFLIITNIDYDHIDYFKNEEEYINSFKKFSYKSQIGLCEYLASKKIRNPYLFTYGFTSKADFYLEDFSFNEDGIYGKVYFQNHYLISFNYKNMYGYHLLENVLCIFAFAYLNHIDLDYVKKKLENFNMPHKRFNIEKFNDNIFINDYAHHPSQIEIDYNTISVLYKGYKKVAIFKPDRLSRFKYFQKQFIDQLKKFDMAFIEKFDEQGDYLIKLDTDKIIYLEEDEEIIKFLNKNEKYAFIFMSSKNQDKVINLIKTYLYE